MSPWPTDGGRSRSGSALLCVLGGLAATPASALAGEAAPARGVLRPEAQASLATDLSARVTKVGFKEGEAFRKGDVLVAFDCRRQDQELASAQAQQREMQVALDSALLLEQRNAGSRNDTETARARADKAHAEAEAIRARLTQCIILAPYDGHVTGLDIHEFEYPVPGRPMLSIIADGEPTIELIVPSQWLGWLRPGEPFQFAVDETGKTYPGEIVRLGAAVDTVSQTVKVFGKFETPTGDVLPGMSGSAGFKRGQG